MRSSIISALKILALRALLILLIVLITIYVYIAQVNIGALVGGLGGLYWISSVSKDLAHLRATPLGGKLNTW